MYSPGAELMPVRIVDDRQCAIQKFAAVPIIGSTYEWVSSTYNFAKQSHPAIQAVFEIAETGVKNIARSTEPLLDIFEPQLSIANTFACRNLDRLQHKFPIMQQTVDQIVTNAIESIYTKLTEAKDIMDTMLDIGIEAAAESVEVTLCSARSAVNTMMEINVAQMMARSVDKMIFKSDDLLERFLPITDEEFLAIAFSDHSKGSGAASLEKQKEEPSYYRRLGSLSIKLCSRAYHHSLIKIKLGAQQTLFQLEQLFYLVRNSVILCYAWEIKERLKYTKEELDHKVHRGQEKVYQMWKEWYKGQPKQGQSNEANQAEMESCALATSYSVAQKMQEVCQKILTNMQSLPEHLQQKIQQAQYDLKELQAVLSTATSFQDLPSGFLKETPKKINKARKAVYEVMEYIAKYTRLSWVDGPYCPAEYSAEESIKQN
ncbi:Perilipin-3, partial [Ophiophagus hannah]